ncbi:MAG: tRNA (adenosine(37)-N6)-threonylcarbamoyltransferase complex transferase subunit TsaD [Candidatus Nealsonbacteria bacterium CG_4_9_14_0_2_um_filter_37_38]|uniref:tRNA N6-adenosine threonylcarbamoyltransferase n=1 Tax=Candidatus Nealsonbacteria bacterium CG_4_10_14_0_8_um_filter_37_14 TaxID=1974684 RepID=A0A2M7R7V6_9BACT|nr:MAG: tRNA (adenosine(37)-N6)-threonylcarbamoyltransferase complex transferase subunit TsaD [Candidatus Nealsonbacteria bacterium CG11_big_fil_rev_8_21_14_0_20_37_68]PIW92405.1 MAG: tRNA (adenosine(37)-N6)-threonylcarbamoyltransferase complex transferase subunit TsaD [Candidatus Nealsonbacteria bacterium CG_4_8_14_3_um_filter_37_23]PIY89683.1 MAG: tRNA (adenosine(37)-N6)-threonylcarbamoyltransferase complex transferase subunit TsaD [Candidatus Nealsonbacteria bacterium CG_4_10_14_0_8_um_filter_
MRVLAIETSCDDTCVAVLKTNGDKFSRFKILSNIISSQVEVHKKWGGVYPALAKREHQKNLTPVLFQALKKAGMLKKSKTVHKIKFCLWSKTLKEILSREENLYKKLKKFLKKYQQPNVDVIAVTAGPGLEPCLWVGVNFAKALSYFWKLPIVPVNHIEAHIIANWILPVGESQIFPAICLVVSGGHTQLILMKKFGQYKILGETRDDAAGECFDKVARILGLGYPGGPIVAKMATKFKIRNLKFEIHLPRPMIYQKNYDFSFSGLKTTVLYDFKNRSQKIRKSKQYIQQMCAEVQQAVIDVLIHKTLKAARNYKIKTIILGGGVAANAELRKQFKEKVKKEIPDSKCYIPDSKLCTDNAAMVGAAVYFHWPKDKISQQKTIAKANLRL